jgi:hypothetical protein
VTERHYAQGSVVKNAAAARVLGMLRNGSGSRRPSAKEQLEQLDENEQTQFLALLVESKKGGAPTN